jgi:hypothetical protein
MVYGQNGHVIILEFWVLCPVWDGDTTNCSAVSGCSAKSLGQTPDCSTAVWSVNATASEFSESAGSDD